MREVLSEDQMPDYMRMALRSQELFEKLSVETNMPTIADMVEEMPENLAKEVLKRFIYARK